jgi:hypothetical protein
MVARQGEDVTLVNRDEDETSEDDYGDYPETRTQQVVRAFVDVSGVGGSARDEGGTREDYDTVVYLPDDATGVDSLHGRGDDEPPSFIIRETGKTYTVMSYDTANNGVYRLGCNIRQSTPPDDTDIPSEVS